MLVPGRNLVPVILLIAIVLCSCQTPQPVAAKPEPPREPKIALVLGGGGAKGFAHVGVIRVLEQEKIPINMIVGTSVGSLIGGIYASNLNSFELEWTAFSLEKDNILDYAILSTITGMGPV